MNHRSSSRSAPMGSFFFFFFLSLRLVVAFFGKEFHSFMHPLLGIIIMCGQFIARYESHHCCCDCCDSLFILLYARICIALLYMVLLSRTNHYWLRIWLLVQPIQFAIIVLRIEKAKLACLQLAVYVGTWLVEARVRCN